MNVITGERYEIGTFMSRMMEALYIKLSRILSLVDKIKGLNY